MTETKKHRFDFQDGLLVVGVASLEAGLWHWSWALAAIVFGIICVCLVFLIAAAKDQARQEAKKKERAS